MKLIFASVKMAPVTLLGFFLLLLIFGLWWHSSRYSERHLLYAGVGTIEIFSASSLIRVRLVPEKVGNFGGETLYRQRNARGRVLFRPVYPGFVNRSGIYELTMGYWHLGFAGFLALVLTGSREGRGIYRRRLHRNGAEGRN